MKIILSNGNEASTVRELYRQWSANRTLTFSNGKEKISFGQAIAQLGGKAIADGGGLYELYDEHGLYVGQVWGI